MKPGSWSDMKTVSTITARKLVFVRKICFHLSVCAQSFLCDPHCSYALPSLWSFAAQAPVMSRFAQSTNPNGRTVSIRPRRPQQIGTFLGGVLREGETIPAFDARSAAGQQQGQQQPMLLQHRQQPQPQQQQQQQPQPQ